MNILIEQHAMTNGFSGARWSPSRDALFNCLEGIDALMVSKGLSTNRAVIKCGLPLVVFEETSFAYTIERLNFNFKGAFDERRYQYEADPILGCDFSYYNIGNMENLNRVYELANEGAHIKVGGSPLPFNIPQYIGPTNHIGLYKSTQIEIVPNKHPLYDVDIEYIKNGNKPTHTYDDIMEILLDALQCISR